MNLHDQLARDLARHDATGPDIAALTGAARREGQRLARRRQSASVVGSALLVLVIAGVTLGVDPGEGGRSDVVAPPVATDGTPPDPSSPTVAPSTAAGPGAETGPATARGAVAALISALGEVSGAATSGYYGQDPLPQYDSLDYYAMVQLNDGAGAADVGINVQFLDGVPTGGCPVAAGGCRIEVQSWTGGQFAFYEVTGDKGPEDVRRVVELVRTDGVRVVATSSNSVDRPDGSTELTRSDPPLTYGQLRDIVEQGYWGADLPQSFLRAGQKLEPFKTAAEPG